MLSAASGPAAAAECNSACAACCALGEETSNPDGAVDDMDLDEPRMEAVIAAVHRFLARTPSALAMFNIEDLAGVIDQVNLPGTVDTYPNWRRRLPVPVDDPGLVRRLHETANVIAKEGRGGNETGT